LGAFEIGIDLGLGCTGDGEEVVDFGDDAVLFRQWRYGKLNRR
jgi:hypothetical protein